MESGIWTQFSPNIINFVETVIRDGRVGICAGNLRISDVTSSCSSVVQQPKCDRFKLVIPYAGQPIIWEVLFDSNSPDEAPDFIFGPEDKTFCPYIEDVQGLVKWDSQNPRALLIVLQDILDHYRKHQLKLLEENSRLQFEYTSLVEQNQFKSDSIEVHVAKSASKTGPVNFLIKLSVDFSKIPAYLTKDNPGEDSAVLAVCFSNPEGSKITPQLFLSPRVEQALGGSPNLRIPPFSNGGCLIDYIPSVCELLTNKVDQIVQGYEKRKEYIAAFLSHFGRSLLEYDSEGFSKISFLLEWNDFFFIVRIELSLFFPKDQPVLTFQSIYHENNSKPYMQVFSEYPYSPRWSGNEMADRARTFILDNVSSFQKSSVMGGSL
ncbi:BRISC and BRCA1-A complex member 2-like [Liolophura sinensis]|uniref:BRISC and BRCA1-A complex member 2-like n=1 Tax=Liolophura sinensis TaxID=3198878 RepID=UPI00315878D3